VRAAGFGRVIPLGFGGWRGTIDVAGYSPRADEDMEINFNAVSPGYFDALGIALLHGRLLDQQDAAGRPDVAVVNETMARRYWGGSAVGRRFQFSGSPTSLEVIGVVRDAKYREVKEPSAPSFYIASLQSTNTRAGVIHVRRPGTQRRGWHRPSGMRLPKSIGTFPSRLCGHFANSATGTPPTRALR
jgi:hypothetical protein